MIFLLPSAYNTRLKPAMASQPQRYGGHEERISLDRASTQTSVLIFSNWKFFLYDVNIMKYVSSTRSRVMVDNGFRPHCQSCVPQVRQSSEEFVSKLLDRRWALPSPHTKIHQITLSPPQLRNGGTFGDTCLLNNAQTALGDGMMAKDELNPSFYILRDDLLHPLVNGNKARKLDGLLPLIEDHSVTDVVTCGGCQSAHAAAVAVSCAERGLKSHLLLRGEQPEILTGYNLISTIYGNVTYVPRSLYANRKEMLKSHANLVAGNSGSVVLLSDIFEASFTSQTSSALNLVQMDANRSAKNCPRKVVIVNEGAGEAVAMLGVIRLVQYLSQNHLFGTERPMKIVVDAGTGTTAVGLGIGALCLGLPWEVTAVMLADTVDGYKQQEKRLISDFKRCFSFLPIDHILNKVCEGVVSWVDRRCPRRFGKVLEGEVEACQQIARQTGILVDPMYTLAAWEMAALLSEEEKGAVNVVVLHTGGTLGMFGLAQRYRSSFRALKDGLST